MTDTRERIRAVLSRERGGPGTFLLEDRGLELARAAGLDVPRHGVVEGPGPGASALLEELGGDRLVVKLLAQGAVHRTDVGGVAVIPAESDELDRLLRNWLETFRALDPRFLLAEYVPEVRGGSELLLGVRVTAEFGPVVTVAPGGILAESTSGALRPEQGPVMLQPATLLGGRGEAVQRILADRNFLNPVARGVRGGEPLLGWDRLLDVLRGMAVLGEEAAPVGLEEFEVNPVRIGSGRAVALDALGRWTESRERRETAGGGAGTGATLSGSGLDALFQPSRIAVAGVSSRSMNPGRVILQNVLTAGFDPGALQVVKEGISELDGVRCVPSVEALDPPVDVLVVGVPAEDVPDLVERAVRAERARSFILISGGLEEGFAPGEATPADRIRGALARAPEPAPRVVGSNCLGIRSVPGRYDTLFIPAWKLGFPERPPAPVAVVSQSGAFAIARASGLGTLNPRILVTLGTQMDVTVGEVLEHLLEDPELRTAACYVEGFRPGDGSRFMAAARAWKEAGRRVILYRAGRSDAGREAAASHTASLAGDYAVTRELARGAGAVLAHTVEEFQDQLLLAALLGDRRPGRRAGVVSNAGFEAVSLADHAGPLELVPFSPRTVEGLESVLERAGLREIVSPRNPLDVTPILGDAGFVEAARTVLKDPGVDVGVVSCVPLTPALQTLAPDQGHPEDLRAPGGMAEGLVQLWRSSGKPWVAAVDAGSRYRPLRDTLLEAGIPVFPTADRAMRALSRWVDGSPDPSQG